MKNVLDVIRGSVRPGLAWAFGLTLIAGFIYGKVNPETFIGIAGPVIGFYFNSREKKNVSEETVSK